jgi:Flp pilus assembly protein TadG
VAEETLRSSSVTAPAPERPPRPHGHFGALRRDQRGQALVEFALVALPLFLIIFGIIDFARALNYYNDLTQIAGQGARAAAVNENPDASVASGNSIQTQLLGNLDSPEMKQIANPVRLNICIASPVPASTGQPVTVTASYVFHFIPLIHPVAITLSASQTERFEGQAASYTPGCVHP